MTPRNANARSVEMLEFCFGRRHIRYVGVRLHDGSQRFSLSNSAPVPNANSSAAGHTRFPASDRAVSRPNLRPAKSMIGLGMIGAGTPSIFGNRNRKLGNDVVHAHIGNATPCAEAVLHLD